MFGRLPTIRAKIFRLHLTYGLSASLMILFGSALDDYVHLRQTRVMEIEHSISTAETLYLRPSGIHHKLAIEHALDASRLRLLCIYNPIGEPQLTWHPTPLHRCPAFLASEGTTREDKTLFIARAMHEGPHYRGMIYGAGPLPEYTEGLIHALVTGFILCALALAASLLTAYRSAHYLSAPIRAMNAQIDCLKEHDSDACPLIPHSPLQETNALAASIASLRTHVATRMVSRETMQQINDWHWGILADLLATLRHRVTPDSDLLPALDDYALLQHLEHKGNPLEAKPFAIATALDQALTSARRSQMPHPQVNLTVSLDSQIPRRWGGQPELFSALLRHLLLLGLKRTRKGYVCLRIGATPLPAAAAFSHRVTIIYEDSGPAIPHVTLERLSTPSRDAYMQGRQDISWLLLGRLLQQLNAGLQVKAGLKTGITLEVTLPLSEHHESVTALPDLALTESAVATLPPLILIVEDSFGKRDDAVRSFHAAGCATLMVESNVHALTLAPILPCSAILLSASAVDANEDIPRRLRHLMDDRMMPVIPLWISLAHASLSEQAHWQKHGIGTVVLKPYMPDVLEDLCTMLPQWDRQFYAQHDVQVRNDLTPASLASMQGLNQTLCTQIAALYPLFDTILAGSYPLELGERAHAVKSAALSLGYFRLGALMGEIEYARTTHLFTAYPLNWQLLKTLLQQTLFDLGQDQSPTQRPATSS